MFNDLLKDQRIAADIVSEVLLELISLTKPGVSLAMLDELAERRIIERGGKPYNKGYVAEWAKEPYPSTICASIDSEICHCFPDRILKEGQIVKYDLGVRYKSGCGDSGLTVPVGEISHRKERLLRYGLRALYEGIKVIKDGLPISSIGRAIEQTLGLQGYTVVREFGGHHIGEEMHEKPHISSVSREEDDGTFLKAGKVICIEPHIAAGDGHVIMMPDGWRNFWSSGEPVAMFEEMILVKEDSFEILTGHLGNKGKTML